MLVRLFWPFLLIALFGVAGCSNDISQDAALDQIEADDRLEAEEMGGLEEDEYEAALDKEER